MATVAMFAQECNFDSPVLRKQDREDGFTINPSHIVRLRDFRDDPEGKYRCVIELSNGKSYIVSSSLEDVKEVIHKTHR